jgi:ATP-dependent Lhr-like helicase
VRQRRRPPQILLTTPESLALLLSYHDAPALFRGLRSVVVDELHALAHTKRGDLLALGLARLTTLAPEHRRVGLSATVHDPGALRRWLAMDGQTAETVRQVKGASAAKAKVEILTTEEYLPWSGHMALHAIREVYARLKRARTTIIFVNTRLEAVVATSSLDLGIDWAAVDLVVQVGAPKGAARLLQRIGRANHRLDQPSEALLVPANRFEVLECRAAIEALDADSLDGMDERPGGLDVLAQHVLGTACSGPFRADDLYAEVRRAAPYRDLSRDDFERVQEFVATGGYALKAYERFRRLKRDAQGAWRVAGVRHVRRYRSNVGTIVEAPRLKVKLKGGRVLGEVEEYFASGLVAGDSFIFSGRLLTFLTIREDKIIVAPAARDAPPKVPAYVGGRLPLSTQLAERVRALLETPAAWRELPAAVAEWLSIQRWASVLPPADGLLVETFPRGEKAFLVAYCFEGRNAHQTLGMLLTRRMERAGLGPLGFVATDYVIAVWSLKPAEDLDALFDEDMLGDDLEDWMAESSMLRRTFRQVAVIAGLIDQRVGGRMRSGREMTVSADLIYDVLRRHQPDHILLQATRLDAAGGLTDIARLAAMLKRVAGKIHHRRLARVSPLAVPILLEIGREQVYGGAIDELLDEGAGGLIAEAMEGMAQAELPL